MTSLLAKFYLEFVSKALSSLRPGVYRLNSVHLEMKCVWLD